MDNKETFTIIKSHERGFESVFAFSFSQFPNGELYLDESLYDTLKELGQGLSLLWKYQTNEDILALMFLTSYLKEEQLFHQFDELIVAYLPYSRMDRKEEGHHNLYSCQYMADIVNHLGYGCVRLNEIHSNQSLELINDSYNINITEQLFQQLIKDKVLDLDSVSIMFPDKGAYHRYKGEYSTFNLLYGEKVRDFTTGKILGLELKGSDSLTDVVVVIDDLTSRGTTFVKSAEKLREQGFKEVYLVVGHAENVMTEGELFKGTVNAVYTTDSMLTVDSKVSSLVNKNKLRVVNFNDLI